MIALDAMGGDSAPHVTVIGAINAARKGVDVGLFGDQDVLIPLLDAADPAWSHLSITVFHCTQAIEMDAEPTTSVTRQTDASLVRACRAVADGVADAVVSAGNSGAALVAGTFILGRVEEVLRPAIGTFLPTNAGSLFCLDLGANADCKPTFLEQFAYMGHLYVKIMKNIPAPRVALLSNGAESYKGPTLVKEAYKRLSASPLNFIGNLEARDIFDDRADVLICDGFSGNVLLKAMQGTASAMNTWMKQESERTVLGRLAGLLMRPVARRIRIKTNYATQGGALLLGLRHPCIIAHGCSNALAIEQALLLAHKTVENKVLHTFNQELTAMLKMASEPCATAATSVAEHDVSM